MILYRGINHIMYEQDNGLLKAKGNVDKAELYPSDHLFPKRTHLPGKNRINAIDKHQDDKRYDEDHFKEHSAFISTSSSLEVAIKYATHKFEGKGYVFFLDKNILEEKGFEICHIQSIVDSPKYPEDDEYLVVMRFLDDHIPNEAILKVLQISPVP